MIEMPVCQHGRPIKLGCTKCYFENLEKDEMTCVICNPSVSELEKRISILENQINNDDIHINHLYEGLEKCFERTEKLQTGNENLDAYILAQNKRVDDLSRMIEKLENSLKEIRQVHNADLSFNEKRIDKLSIDLEFIEKRHEWCRDDLNKVLALICDPESIPGRPSNFKLIEGLKNVIEKLDNKKPYKCPACDGIGERIFDVMELREKINLKEFWEKKKEICKSCDGKGIVWI